MGGQAPAYTQKSMVAVGAQDITAGAPGLEVCHRDGLANPAQGGRTSSFWGHVEKIDGGSKRSRGLCGQGLRLV
jgi:hypothetical protein